MEKSNRIPFCPDEPFEENKRKANPQATTNKPRNLHTKYLNKRHRFFRARVSEEFADAALEAIEDKLKELVELYNGDLHVCKLSGKNEITAYFITNDTDSDIWADELKKSIRAYITDEEPSLIELRPLR